jgi:Flp pilus assembly protein TadB
MRCIRHERQGARKDSSRRLDDHAATREEESPKQLGLTGRRPVSMSVMSFLMCVIMPLHRLVLVSMIAGVVMFVIMVVVVAMVVVIRTGMLVRCLVIMRHYNLPTSSCPTGLTRALISAVYFFRY